ncbi:MAG TPA: hypothetical protein PKC18_06755, partial [Lacipirellulaceae bacterium]|nr:hypothetical protein [Lacipirellulaceae bacterium]
MQRTRQLTWLPGADGRRGRWRKKYHGRVYYFDGGRGKSDEVAYTAALASWEAKKLGLDAESPNPHSPTYENAIDQWQRVLTWSRQHGEEAMCEIAMAKLARLNSGLSRRPFRPPAEDDLFPSYFKLESRLPALARAYRDFGQSRNFGQFSFQQAEPPRAAAAPTLQPSEQVIESLQAGRTAALIQPAQLMFEPDPLVIEQAVWQDRLEVMDRRAQASDASVQGHVESFLAVQHAKTAAGQLSLGRLQALRIHLHGFVDWLGGHFPVAEIKSQTLSDFHRHLLGLVEAQKWTSATASSCMVSVKTFVRWLWRTEAIPTLPRILDASAKDLEIAKSRQTIVTFTGEEISALLASASARTGLYILLSLNTAMTQKDIADLDLDEVDWREG